MTLEQLEIEARHLFGPGGSEDARTCLAVAGEFGEALRSMLVLSGLGYGVVRPVFRKTTAIGSLMRRKLEPVMEPLGERLESLLGSDRQ